MFSKVCLLSRNSWAASAVSRKFDLRLPIRIRLPIAPTPLMRIETIDTMGDVGNAGEGHTAKTRYPSPQSGEKFPIAAIAELLAAQQQVANAISERLLSAEF